MSIVVKIILITQRGPRRRFKLPVRSYLMNEDFMSEHPYIVDYARHLFNEREITEQDRICRPCSQRAYYFFIKELRALEQEEVTEAAQQAEVEMVYDYDSVETDMENYLKYQLMGGQRKLKKGVLPHKFDCQKNEKKEPIEKLRYNKQLLERDSPEAEIDYFEVNVKPDPLQLEVVACRGCLATDTKLYNIHVLQITQFFRELSSSEISPHDGLPQYICEHCKAYVAKFSAFRARCRQARAALLTAYDEGMVDTNYVKTMDRSQFFVPLKQTVIEALEFIPDANATAVPKATLTVLRSNMTEKKKEKTLTSLTKGTWVNTRRRSVSSTTRSAPSKSLNSSKNIVSGKSRKIVVMLPKKETFDDEKEQNNEIVFESNSRTDADYNVKTDNVDINKESFVVHCDTKTMSDETGAQDFVEKADIRILVDLTDNLNDKNTNHSAEKCTNTSLNSVANVACGSAVNDTAVCGNDIPNCLIGDTKRPAKPKVKRYVPKRKVFEELCTSSSDDDYEEVVSRRKREVTIRRCKVKKQCA